MTHGSQSTSSPQAAERIDYPRVTTENLSKIAFEQAYELLRSAPPEALILDETARKFAYRAAQNSRDRA